MCVNGVLLRNRPLASSAKCSCHTCSSASAPVSILGKLFPGQLLARWLAHNGTVSCSVEPVRGGGCSPCASPRHLACVSHWIRMRAQWFLASLGIRQWGVAPPASSEMLECESRQARERMRSGQRRVLQCPAGTYVYSWHLLWRLWARVVWRLLFLLLGSLEAPGKLTKYAPAAARATPSNPPSPDPHCTLRRMAPAAGDTEIAPYRKTWIPKVSAKTHPGLRPSGALDQSPRHRSP